MQNEVHGHQTSRLLFLPKPETRKATNSQKVYGSLKNKILILLYCWKYWVMLELLENTKFWYLH